MSECLLDMPRYIRQQGDEWEGADHKDGPWRPITAPQSGLPWPNGHQSLRLCEPQKPDP